MMEWFYIVDYFEHGDTQLAYMPWGFINYATLWLSVNISARIRTFLQQQLTLQKKFAALPPENNSCSRARPIINPNILKLIQ